MDAIEMLTQDHREVEELFAMYEGSINDTTKEQLVEKLCKALKVHMALEEELFYPEARRIFGPDDDDLVDDAEDEHSKAKEIIESIKKRDPGFILDVQVKALEMALAHHVQEEEEEMFPRLTELGIDAETLGERMQERKAQLLQQL